MNPSFAIRRPVAMTTTAVVVAMITVLMGRCRVVDAASGCAAAQLCCRQKDSTCRVTGQRMSSSRNTSISNIVGRTCFCDAGCLELNDCCVDYRQHCSVVDCELSDSWSDWGECSVLCGLGIKERHRRVVRHAQNGGRACLATDTVQRAVCEGVTCKVPRAISPAVLQQLREIGRILPLSYARWRQSKTYNPYTGSRKHLLPENRPVDSPTSCAQYEITSARLPCHKPRSTNSWTKQLKMGSEVCVECQPPSPGTSFSGGDDVCRGRGVLNRETRWSAMTSPGCHGTWVMKTRWQHCSCAGSGRDTSSYVFV